MAGLLGAVTCAVFYVFSVLCLQDYFALNRARWAAIERLHKVYGATDDDPLIIPEEAVVVAGSRNITRGKGKEWGISLYTPVIVKYRDAKTDAKLQLEDLLR